MATELCEHCGGPDCARSSTPEVCIHTSLARKSVDAPKVDKQVKAPEKKK